MFNARRTFLRNLRLPGAPEALGAADGSGAGGGSRGGFPHASAASRPRGPGPVQSPEAGINSIGPFTGDPRVSRHGPAHDLRRARTRTDLLRPRGPRAGRRGAGLGPRRRTRHGDGGRLCVRLDRPERDRGGGGRRQHDLAPAPQVLTPRAPSDADTDPHPHADTTTTATTATASSPAAGTEPAATAARPDRAANRAGAAAPRGPPGASPGAADAPAPAEATARPGAGALRHAHPAPVRHARALPGAPPGGPGRAAHPRRHVAAHLRPADHHARRGRRRRAAAALIRTTGPARAAHPVLLRPGPGPVNR